MGGKTPVDRPTVDLGVLGSRDSIAAKSLQRTEIMNATAQKKRSQIVAVQQARASDADAAPLRTAKLALGPLPALLGYTLRRAQLAVFADFHTAFAPLGLRPAQFSALVLIDANPGCKQSEAADALGIMQPNFVALMDDLEARGLARRAPAKIDRRSYALELTGRGRLLLARAMTTVAAHETRVTAGLSEVEAKQMFALLARIEQGHGNQPDTE